jgi:hypothetical protein
LALGNDALEVSVRDRVILDVHGEPLHLGVEARPLRDRPAQQHAVELEPEVVVQSGSGVLLDHETELAVGARGDRGVAGGLAGDAKIALAVVLVEGHARML